MGYYFETAGFDFEAEFTEKVSDFSLKTWGSKALKFSTLAEDKYAGTDFYLLGIPVDVTINYGGKNKMKHLDCDLNVLGFNVQFGIRYGNGKLNFKTPVLVIGVEGVGKHNMYLSLNSLSENLEEILNTGMDAYLEAVPE